ncbi:MAG: hypothetical protein Q4E75_06485 [bacterium]|nr:hypothetical protein [bacterium]
MRNVKNILGVLVISIASFFCFSVVSKAQNYNADKAIIVVPTPSVGDKASDYDTAMFYAYKVMNKRDTKIMGNKKNVIGITGWKDEDGTTITGSDTFKNNKSYKPVFAVYEDNGLNPYDYYSIVDSTILFVNPTYNTENFSNTDNVKIEEIVAVINDDTRESISYGDWEGIYPTQMVYEIHIDAVEPVVGEKPNTVANLSSDVKGAFESDKINISWFEDGNPMNEGDIFRAGHTYTYNYSSSDYELNDKVEIDVNVIDFFNNINMSEDECSWYLPYSYKYLEGTNNITDIAGEIKSLVFKIDADYTKFESIKIGDVELTSDDYEVSEGSTVIALNESGLKKVNNLKKGTYEVKVKFSDRDAEVISTLTLNDPEKNPSTLDSISSYILIIIASLIGIISVSLYMRKRFN